MFPNSIDSGNILERGTESPCGNPCENSHCICPLVTRAQEEKKEEPDYIVDMKRSSLRHLPNRHEFSWGWGQSAEIRGNF